MVSKEKHRDKYRIRSARAQWWDYRSEGAYFITICTKNREHFFGEITDVVETQGPHVETQCIASLQSAEPQMHLSPIGEIVEIEWLKTPEIRVDMNLSLAEFTVMPNHFHGIIIIGENDYNRQFDAVKSNQFGPQSKNLGSIIRGFKSAVTTAGRLVNPEFEWQDRFHDHIIRDNEEYDRIVEYIINNVANWKQDKFYS